MFLFIRPKFCFTVLFFAISSRSFFSHLLSVLVHCALILKRAISSVYSQCEYECSAHGDSGIGPGQCIPFVPHNIHFLLHRLMDMEYMFKNSAHIHSTRCRPLIPLHSFVPSFHARSLDRPSAVLMLQPCFLIFINNIKWAVFCSARQTINN